MRRITVIIADDVMIKLRKLQSQKIKQLQKTVSLSQLINELLRESIKN